MSHNDIYDYEFMREIYVINKDTYKLRPKH